MSTEWNPEKETVVISGASGLIGTQIVRELSHDYNLVGMDLKSGDDDSLPLNHIDTDLTDDQSVEDTLVRIKALFGHQIASVIHLAAYYDFTGKPSHLYQDLTVEGTRRFLKGLQKHEFEVGQFVFSSSLLVMEPDENGRRFSELSPTQAEWEYPRSKLAAEQVIREEHGEIPAVILRIAGVYDEKCHSLPISQQISRIYEKQLESYVFPGNATHGQAVVHLHDLATCFRNVVERRERLEKQDLFLVAESDVVSYEELQDMIGQLIHGTEWPTIRVPKTVAKVVAYVQEKMPGQHDNFIKPWMIDLADDHYAANIAHASVKLGWKPKHRLRETLPQMIEFLKSDPAAFYRENKLPMPSELAN